jgi:hypothetical protein
MTDSGEPRRLADIPTGERRRAVLSVVGRTVVITAAVLLIYFSIPLEDSQRLTDTDLLLFGIGGLLLVAAAVVWRIRSLARADFPGLRAAETAVIVFFVFLVVFATIYLAISSADAGAFTEELNHTTALYFTVTVLTTVGFGDITAVDNGTRGLVTTQMLLNLVVLGVLGRGLFVAARSVVDQAGR